MTKWSPRTGYLGGGATGDNHVTDADCEAAIPTLHEHTWDGDNFSYNVDAVASGLSTDQKHGGAKSVKWVREGVPAALWYVGWRQDSSDISLVAGTFYKWAVWVYVGSAAPTLQARVRFYDSLGNPISELRTTATLSGAWEKLSVFVEVPHGATTAGFFIGYFATPSDTDVFYTDDFELYEIAGKPVRMLAEVTHSKNPDEFTGTDEDLFNRADTEKSGKQLGDGWAEGGWKVNEGTVEEPKLVLWDNYPVIKDNRVIQARRGAGGAYYRTGISNGDLSDTTPCRLQMTVGRGQHDWPNWGNVEVHLYARLDDDVPDFEQDGVLAGFALHGDQTWEYQSGTWVIIKSFVDVSGRLYVNKAGDEESRDDFTPVQIETNTSVQISLEMLGNVCKVYANEMLILTKTIVALSGRRVGFGMKRLTEYPPYLDDWILTGKKVFGEPIQKRTRLVASAGGSVCEETSPGILELITGDQASLSSDYSVMAQECNQELFIAEYGTDRLNGTDGTIGGAGHDELTATGVSDWTTYDIDVDNDVCIVTDAEEEGPTEATYKISAVVAAKLTLASSAGADGTCSYRIEKAPKVYIPGASPAMGLWTATIGKGAVPSGCEIICLYRGRVVLARQAIDLINWHMSRQADPYDWDTGATDVQGAISGHTSEAGKLGQPITALMPFRDDYLIFACERSLWLLRGDPADGGAIDNISFKDGIVGKFAWCDSPDGIIYFLGKYGLYAMDRNFQPKNLSLNLIPQELSNISAETHDIFMAWDGLRYGVMIFITSREAGTSTHYFYDARLDGFWPDQYPTDHGPTMMLDYGADSVSYRAMILGGRDGYLRRFSDSAKSDDGTAVNSYCTFAPVLLGRDEGQEGILTELRPILSADTDNLDYEIRVGNSHEAAVNAAARVSGRWNGGGRKPPILTPARGNAIALRLSNSRNNQNWACESISGVVVAADEAKL